MGYLEWPVKIGVLRVPPEIQIRAKLRGDQKKAQGKVGAEQTRLGSSLSAIRNRMDAAYLDKLNGKIRRNNGTGR